MGATLLTQDFTAVGNAVHLNALTTSGFGWRVCGLSNGNPMSFATTGDFMGTQTATTGGTTALQRLSDPGSNGYGCAVWEGTLTLPTQYSVKAVWKPLGSSNPIALCLAIPQGTYNNNRGVFVSFTANTTNLIGYQSWDESGSNFTFNNVQASFTFTAGTTYNLEVAVTNTASGFASLVVLVNSVAQTTITLSHFSTGTGVGMGSKEQSTTQYNEGIQSFTVDRPTIAPGAPTSVGGTWNGSSAISVAWVAPSSGDSPTSYVVERATSVGGPYAAIGTVTAGGPATNFTDSSFLAGATYFYEVEAINTAGSNTSIASPGVVIPVTRIPLVIDSAGNIGELNSAETLNGHAQMTGTTAGDNAVAGNIGEFVTGSVASGSAVSLTNATTANVTSITLAAGDWDVFGIVDYATSAATTTHFKSGISTTTAAFGSQDTFADWPLSASSFTDTLGHVLPPVRISASTSTVVFLVANAKFSAGSVSAFGTIRARRIR